MRADRPSSTALLIAAAQVLARRRAALRELVAPDTEHYCRTFLRASAQPWRWLERRLDARPVQWLMAALERLTLPGIGAHYVLRKRRLRRWAEAALADGCEQLVVLGAGLDTLALELARERRSLRCIEIDHPATQSLKRAALRRAGEPDTLSLAAADLGADARASLPAALVAARFDPRKRTLFVAEGLVMYLQRRRVLELLADLRCACPDGAIAFGFMEPDRRGRARFRDAAPWLTAWLSLVGEPFRWAADRALVAALLRRRGIEIAAMADNDALRAEAGVKAPACAGEVYLLGRWSTPTSSTDAAMA